MDFEIIVCCTDYIYFSGQFSNLGVQKNQQIISKMSLYIELVISGKSFTSIFIGVFFIGFGPILLLFYKGHFILV